MVRLKTSFSRNGDKISISHKMNGDIIAREDQIQQFFAAVTDVRYELYREISRRAAPLPVSPATIPVSESPAVKPIEDITAILTKAGQP